MKRILSIDFDYFINTGIYTRNEKFPDGEDHLANVQDIWLNHYLKYPEIHNIGVTLNFHNYCRALRSLEKGKVLIADSHADIVKVFNDIDVDERLEVVNIDFHHDNYITGGDTLDCANWVRHLMTKRPNTKFYWVRREDSETVSLEGEFPYPHGIEYLNTLDFDYVFLCFSPEWTPPHLRPYFNDLCRAVDHLDKF